MLAAMTRRAATALALLALACRSNGSGGAAPSAADAGYGPDLDRCRAELAAQATREAADPDAELTLNAELCAVALGQADAICREALAEKRREIARDRSLSGADKARMRAALDAYACD